MVYQNVIDKISAVHGEYPGCVDVNFHREIDGQRDGFESTRIPLTSAIIKPDGSIDEEEVSRQVWSEIGETEEI